MPIRTATFNLGWLPGGDKRITPHWETTRAAISAALSLLVKGGVCTICAYPGHAAGDEERAALMAYLSALRPQAYNVLHHRFLNAGAGAPECFVVHRHLRGYPRTPPLNLPEALLLDSRRDKIKRTKRKRR